MFSWKINHIAIHLIIYSTHEIIVFIDETFLVESPELIKLSIWITQSQDLPFPNVTLSWNKIREFFFLSQGKQEDMKIILEGIDPMACHTFTTIVLSSPSLA